MYFKHLLACGILFICLSGCAPSLYIPTVTDAELSGTSLDGLKKGRELYVAKCGSCHNLYLPAAYTKQVWLQEIEEMQIRAKIDDSQKELIVKYLETKAKSQ
jgi:hypothetical protein